MDRFRFQQFGGGKNHRRRSKGLSPTPAWVEMLENRVLLSGTNVLTQPLTTLPGDNTQGVEVQFQLTEGMASFEEVGVFAFDADGTVGGVSPSSPDFGQAVLDSPTRQTVFLQGESLGAQRSIPFRSGTQLGLYLCNNLTASQGTGQVSLSTISPTSFEFSFEEIASLFADADLFDDMTRQFDDAVISLNLVGPVELPVPAIGDIPEQTIGEEAAFEFALPVTNPEGPASDLRFRLVSGPQGATLGETDGVLRWTPTETQGPGRFDVVFEAFLVSRPDLVSRGGFVINVSEVNRPPSFNAFNPPDFNVGVQSQFTISATDPDLPLRPGNRFTFALDDNPLAPGATLDANTGVFTWTPTAPGAFIFTVRVTDNGNPALETSEQLTIQVLP